MANHPLKEQVLVRDVASFKWKVAWLRGVEVVDIKVLVRAVMSQGIPLLEGLEACLTGFESSQGCAAHS